MGQVKMGGVGMRLQAISHLIQRTAVHVRCRHNVGTEINQQIIIDQRSRPFPKTRPTERAWLGAVWALAKSLWEGICGGCSKESEGHLLTRLSDALTYLRSGMSRIASSTHTP